MAWRLLSLKGFQRDDLRGFHDAKETLRHSRFLAEEAVADDVDGN